MDVHSREIERYRRELESDPASLKFVPLADMLRRAGDFEGAGRVLSEGAKHHPELRSALLVRARLWLDQGRNGHALGVLEDAYSRDAGNVALTVLYCEVLIQVGRFETVEEVLRRSQYTGIPDDILNQLEAALETARHPEASDEDDDDSLASLGGVLTLPGLYLEDLGDPFAVPVVAARVSRAGRRNEAKAIWREVAQHHPAFIARANREIARLSGIAGRLGKSEAPGVVLMPSDRAEAAHRVRKWAKQLGLDV